MTFVWVLALIGSILGGFTLLGVFLQTGAPQQGALAAIAVGLAVIPYCFARAIEKMRGNETPAPKWTPATVDGAITCRSCGKPIRPRPGETHCYLCKNPLSTGP